MTFSPTRPELYGPVHKGLRWAGTHALVTVGACAGDAASTARALDPDEAAAFGAVMSAAVVMPERIGAAR